MNTRNLLAILLLSLTLVSCSKPPKDLSSYESAKEWVKASYEAEVMKPDSSDIHRVEYYPSSPRKWLIVYFKSNKSKGYIYQNVPASLWTEWQAAPSKGKWYKANLKGNRAYFFTPE